MSTTTPDSTAAKCSTSLIDRYRAVRSFTDRIAAPLSPEDCMIQSMEDASPARWHMAHTTWFFETFVLAADPAYRDYDPLFRTLFNSYYNAVGDQFPRPNRGMISRPGVDEVRQYRAHVDAAMEALLAERALPPDLEYVIEVGLHHEQQHQELMLTDLKHAFASNPSLPVYESADFAPPNPTSTQRPGTPTDPWLPFPKGIVEIGHDGDDFSYDNESPRHRVFLHDFAIARSLVTNGQWIEFINDGGYQRPDHWLSMGWSEVNSQGWDAPLYWVQRDGKWHQFTLSGLVELNPDRLDWPVCHISYFEADAFARWAGHRLPTEFEWEHACQSLRSRESGGDTPLASGSQFADCLMQDGAAIHPTQSTGSLTDLHGGVWQWTSSSYAAYPGYAPPSGALGEYNGKFMCNQYVLRGGSVATSRNHIRPTYRNFFPPTARWQFSGLRLAKKQLMA